jgi:hypothetical protein
MLRVVGGSQRGKPLSVQTHRVVVMEFKLHIGWDLKHPIQLVRAGEERRRKEGGRTDEGVSSCFKRLQNAVGGRRTY